jgi:hypothetical protein
MDVLSAVRSRGSCVTVRHDGAVRKGYVNAGHKLVGTTNCANRKEIFYEKKPGTLLVAGWDAGL